MSGILRLESLTKGNTLRQGDLTLLKYRLFDADGDKLDISGKSATVRLMKNDFTFIAYEKEGLTVAPDDTISFNINKILTGGLYHLEVIVDDKYIFPSRSDEGKFNVDKSSLGAELTIIENAGIDAVVRKAVDLINEDPNLIIDEDRLVTDIIANTGIKNIDEYYQAYSDVIKELSKDKDYHSLPEIVGARRGYSTLSESLQNLSPNMLNPNLGKLTQNHMSDELLAQIAGDAAVNAVPADGSITTQKIAGKAVTADRTDFAKKMVTSNNLFNPDGITEGKFISGNVSTSDLSGYFISGKFGYDTPTTLTIRNIRTYRFYDEAGVAYGVVDTESNTAVTTLTIPTGHTLEFSGSLSNLGTTQVNIGETLLPYDEYTEVVVIENLYTPTDNEENSENFKVVKSGNLIDVISKSGTDELIIKLNLSTRDNKLFNFLSTTLNGNVIHGTTDSITPIRVPYAIGANHGYPTGGTQFYPAVKNIDLKVEGIGDHNGTYTPDKLKIVESYDILDWNSVTEWETQNPSKPYADNLSQIDSVARLSTSYEFSYFGRCYISTSVYFYKSTEIGNLGFLQAEGLYGGNGDYAGVTRYAPDVKTVSGYNFQNGFDLDNLVDNLKISQADLKDINFPIVRYADYTSDYGFTMGYFFDKGDTNPANRLAVADYYWDFRNTKKSYPIAYDATHTVSAGEYINIYGYRNYYLKDDDLTIYTEVEDGEAIYIYIDTNKPLDLKTKRTLADVGSKIEVLRNTGLTLISDYVTSDGIIFKTAEYCTAVLKINK